jgi:hypothetical protein
MGAPFASTLFLRPNQEKRMETETNKCSVCDESYEGMGNNASPFSGRCCDACNWFRVMPARCAGITEDMVQQLERSES